MVFEVVLTPAASTFFVALRKASQIFLKNKIDELTIEPEKYGKQAEGALNRYWQLGSAGQYQVTYVINKKLKKVTVVSIRPIFP